MFLTAKQKLGRKYMGHANALSQAYARLSDSMLYIVSTSENHNSEQPGSLLGLLFCRVRSGSQSKTGNVPKPLVTAGAADPAVSPAVGGEWESLDGRFEKKSIYKYFAAHDAPSSQALFAFLATLQYLADHKDAILARPKLRCISAMSGNVENVCWENSDGSFVGPMPKGALPMLPLAFSTSAATVAASQRVEGAMAIIMSADVNVNIHVFRKDINFMVMSMLSPTAVAAAASAEEDTALSSSSVISQPQTGQQQPASLRGSPSLWSRLNRRVSQRCTSGSFFVHSARPQDSMGEPQSSESMGSVRSGIAIKNIIIII
ncbi:hypothetical protein GGI15_003062 [Coemansia interrupta]|uniref:Uncharacterized protein n=1 Tax=Coemansia interrupta TaxID=1126814 RepID=A0A9W8LJV5_9FUNG|nr:hypothetical protein GGI15_003062 [Coemansia interrupta]